MNKPTNTFKWRYEGGKLHEAKGFFLEGGMITCECGACAVDHDPQPNDLTITISFTATSAQQAQRDLNDFRGTVQSFNVAVDSEEV
jgi:hypothetical protein